MSSDPNVTNEIDIAIIAGPPFIIIIINWALFGILSIQVYLYSQAFPNDRRLLKILVFGIYILEMAQTLLLTQTLWSVLVTGFGNISGMNDVGTTWFSIPTIGGLVALLVQWFCAYRILIISQKKIIPGFIVLMSLISFAGALATAIIARNIGQFTKLLLYKSKTFTVFGVWDVAGSLCDIMITMCMCYYLHQGTRRCGSGIHSQTEALVSKLIRITVETGMLTTSISILILALYFSPSLYFTSYYEVPVSAQAKLYSTTMLAVLNSRIKLGIVSESATWRDNELEGTIPLSHSQNLGALRFNVVTTSSHQEINITTEEPKAQNNNHPEALDTPYSLKI